MLEIWSSYSYINDSRLQGYDLHSSVKHQHFGKTCCSPRTVYTLRVRCQDPQIISSYLPLDMVSYPEHLYLKQWCFSISLIISACSQCRYVSSQVHSWLFSASNMAVFKACMSKVQWWYSCTVPLVELTLLQQRIKGNKMLQHYPNMVTLHNVSFKFILLESCYNAVCEFPHE